MFKFIYFGKIYKKGIIINDVCNLINLQKQINPKI